MNFIKKIFHKISYRIYIIGFNQHNELLKKSSIPGVDVISKKSDLNIGKNVSFGGNVLLMGGGKITIGDDTMIAAGAIIHSTTHDYTLHPMNEVRIDKDTIIGNHVWIGTGAIVLPGVEIGDYSVVGAGSIVTKNVLPGEIVVGVPAKKIKQRNIPKKD